MTLRVDHYIDGATVPGASGRDGAVFNPATGAISARVAFARVARRFCHSVQAGMVGVNVPIPVPVAYHSFGGWKRSLFGALHVHGPDGVRFYTRLKTVTARWPENAAAGSDFNLPTL